MQRNKDTNGRTTAAGRDSQPAVRNQHCSRFERDPCYRMPVTSRAYYRGSIVQPSRHPLAPARSAASPQVCASRTDRLL
jgi:hypothetical protein